MNLKVLVVEDDLPSLELLKTVLELQHVEVRPLSSGVEAKTLIEREQFDGVFLDLMMPGVDGFELARGVRKSRLNNRAPIVIVSGREEADTMREAFAVGGTFFLKKPIDRQKVRTLFQSVCGAMHDSRRRMARVSLHTDVACGASGQSFSCASRNISMGGMLIECGRAVEVGAKLQLEFRLPGTLAQVRTGAVVRRVDEKGRMGVAFTDLRTSDRQLIRDLLESE